MHDVSSSYRARRLRRVCVDGRVHGLPNRVRAGTRARYQPNRVRAGTRTRARGIARCRNTGIPIGPKQ